MFEKKITDMTPIIEELKDKFGDIEYRNRDNFLKTHKIKMLDVLVEMKRLFPFDTRVLYGKIYTRTNNLRFHPLYPYFCDKRTYGNRGEWINKPPTWFKDKLIKSITEHPYLKAQEKFIEKCIKIIQRWYDNVDKNTEWDEKRENHLPAWCVKDLFRDLNSFCEWKSEWIYINGYTYFGTNKFKDEYTYCEKIKKEILKKPDAEGYYTICEVEGYIKDVEIPENIKDEYEKWKKMIKDNITLFTKLQKVFAENQNVDIISQEYKNVLTLKINRLFNGVRMDTQNTHIWKFHMTRWKKTMTNGNCSNKNITATHLYYGDKKGGWIFKAVKIYDAEMLCLQNGFPQWGKKGNGKKKPTYRELKMWWYKLE